MEDLIRKKEVLDALKTLAEDFEVESRYKMGKAVRMAYSDVYDMEPVKVEQTKVLMTATGQALRKKCIEPFGEGFEIGHEVYRCDACDNRVRKAAKFCDECGRRLVDKIVKPEVEKNAAKGKETDILEEA